MSDPNDKPAASPNNVVSFANARKARGQPVSGLSAQDLAQLEEHFADKEYGGTLLPAGSNGMSLTRGTED